MIKFLIYAAIVLVFPFVLTLIGSVMPLGDSQASALPCAETTFRKG